ncbi:MAG: 50S ribosomal protein L21 [Candidatus Pacebacteria bacterium]|nr:50S ribosomal protein L21 [Candidatus Paceibacterota bacterium]
MYAIVSLQGQQFRVEPGETLAVNRMDAEPGETVTVKDGVLLAKNDDGLKVGSPRIDGATVELEVLEHFRGDKITVFKMKRRKRYRRKNGHRQEWTRVRVSDISLG